MMDTHDTIVAPASAYGRSAVAVVRVSGPGTASLLQRVLAEDDPGVRGAFHVRFMLLSAHGLLPLPCKMLRFVAPRSYTGEDAAELIVPGNPHLVSRVVDALTSHEGVRHAGPGEFTARAYLAGRLTLSEAEGVAATIAAARDDELDAAATLRRGTAGLAHAALADELASLLALVEAGIDFTDQEDVVPVPAPELQRKLAELADRVRALRGPAASEAGTHRPLVVLAGAPSAGKSTLFNALLGRRRTLVATEPGTTRDVIVEPLDGSADAPGTPVVDLADLAGLDAHPIDEPSRAAQQAAHEALARADVVIHCDPAGRFAPLDGVRASTPILRVRTKADLPTAPGAAHDALAVCALAGGELGPLRRAIADAAHTGSRGATAAALVPRQRRLLTAAHDALCAACDTLDAQDDGATALAEPELVAGAMRDALDHLGELAGRVTPDDVLGRVFAGFCVGK